MKEVWAGAMVWHAKALDTKYDKKKFNFWGSHVRKRELSPDRCPRIFLLSFKKWVWTTLKDKISMLECILSAISS